MDQLSPQQKVCIHLRAEGMRYREIAEVLGVSISTVEEFLARAIARLRMKLT
jgi:RNA polymerase sigma-70 factor (ECF subfamily)